jgi:S1-C subfamily serine protease
MRVEDLDASMARRFRLEDSESGVVVVEVSPFSAAAEAGVQPGDIIKRIGDTEIDSAREFRTAISRVNDEDSILLLIRRRGGSIFLPIELN